MTVTLEAARQEAPVLPFPEPSTPSCETVEISGRPVTVTPVFDTYWRFAAARQHIYEARQANRGHGRPTRSCDSIASRTAIEPPTG